MWNSGFVSTKRAHHYRLPGSDHQGAWVGVFSGRPVSRLPFHYCVSQRKVGDPLQCPPILPLLCACQAPLFQVNSHVAKWLLKCPGN